MQFEEPIAACPKKDLNACINEIVTSHVEHRKHSQEHALRRRVAKAKIEADDRQQRRDSNASQPSPSPAKSMSNTELAYIANSARSGAEERKQRRELEASPAKVMSNVELAYHAHCALSAAKERNTPAKSAPAQLIDWDCYYEPEVFPCQLNFADEGMPETKYDDSVLSTLPAGVMPELPTFAAMDETQYEEPVLSASPMEPAGVIPELPTFAAMSKDDEKENPTRGDVKIDIPPSIPTSAAAPKEEAGKAEALPVPIQEIPSPTRNRAKRQRELLAKQEAEIAAKQELEASWQSREAKQELAAAMQAFESTHQEEEQQQSLWPSWQDAVKSCTESAVAASPPAKADVSSEQKRNALASPALFRMLRNSATPSKCSPFQGAAQRVTEHEVTARRKAALEAWGGSASPAESEPSPAEPRMESLASPSPEQPVEVTGFMFQ
jgi:hypothetical protein